MASREVRFLDAIGHGAGGGTERCAQIVEPARGEEGNASRADFWSRPPSHTPGATDRRIGTGNRSTPRFQLAKRDTAGAQSWTRAITEPAVEPESIALKGTTRVRGWSISTAIGLVTFATVPALASP